MGTTYLMLGKYQPDALRSISSQRTDQAVGLVKKLGGEVQSIYALLGGYDLMILAEFPGIEEAIKASVALSRETGIGFTTSPAIPVAVFDRIMGG